MIGLLAFISFADPIQVDRPRLDADIDAATESRDVLEMIIGPLA
jgi:hypothetical protein